MKAFKKIALLLILESGMAGAAEINWIAQLRQELPLLGDRNWIVIVDSAYPWEVSPGVETIETGASQATVLREVLQEIARSPHVRPTVFRDTEFSFLTERDAPGVTVYRQRIGKILGNRPVHYVLHEKQIHNMNEAGNTFHVLILKTTLTIPYTSVFMRLDCKYWSDASEAKLRKTMKQARATGPSLP